MAHSQIAPRARSAPATGRFSRCLLMVASLAACAPILVAAQQRARSLDEVTRLFRSGMDADRLLDQLRLDCIDFGLNRPTLTRLREAGAKQDFVDGLQRVCYAGGWLAVESEPDSALVLINGDTIGRAPAREKVAPTANAQVVVSRGAVRRQVTVPVTAGTETAIKLVLPSDTVVWPRVRAERELVVALGLGAKYPILPDTLLAPMTPEVGSGWVRFLIGGAVVGGAAFGAGSGVCKQQLTGPPGGGYLSNGTPVAPGQVVSLGASSGCTIGIAAGGALVGGLLNAWWLGRGDGHDREAYAQARAAYPLQVQRLHASRDAQGRAIEGDSVIMAARAQEEQALRTVQARNQQVLGDNRSLAAPRVTQVVVDPTFAPKQRDVAVGAGPGGSGASGALVEEALTADVDVEIPRGTEVRDKAIAVVIGNRTYTKRDVPPVDFAVNDARTMREYLVRTFGFKPENIIFEENASLSTFTRIFGDKANEKGQLFNYLAADSASDVFVFYSGHGAPDPNTAKAYLVPTDADPQLLQLTGYSLEVMYTNLGKLPIKSVTVVLDACFSGTSDRGTLFKGISPALLRVETPLLAAPNAAVLAASAANQVSGWYEEKKHGLFSYWLFKGLQGAADANGDRQITLQELNDYAVSQVVPLSRRLKNREQVPVITSNAADRTVLKVASP